MNGGASVPLYQLQWRKLWFLLGCGWLLFVMVMSLVALEGNWGYTHSDKVLHMFAYATSMGWFMQLYPETRQRLLLALLIGAQGVAMEFAQRLTAYRSFDYWDMAANCSGVLIAWSMGGGLLGRLLLYLEAWLRGEHQLLPLIVRRYRLGGEADRSQLQLPPVWQRLGYAVALMALPLLLLFSCRDLRDWAGFGWMGDNTYRLLGFALVALAWMELLPRLRQRVGLLVLMLSLALGMELYYQFVVEGFFFPKHFVMAVAGILFAFVIGFTPLGYLPWYLKRAALWWQARPVFAARA